MDGGCTATYLTKIQKSGTLTQECGADVLGDLVAGLARLREVAQLLVQHALELKVQHSN